MIQVLILDVDRVRDTPGGAAGKLELLRLPVDFWVVFTQETHANDDVLSAVTVFPFYVTFDAQDGTRDGSRGLERSGWCRTSLGMD